MQLILGSNASEIAGLLRQAARDAPQVLAKGVMDATRVMWEGSRQLLSTLIYNKPIPVYRSFRRIARPDGGFRKSARPSMRAAWKRTSTLLRNERYFFRGSGADIEGLIDNKTPYTGPRHDLDRPSPYPEYDNEAHWRTEAKTQYSESAMAKFREALEALSP